MATNVIPMYFVIDAEFSGVVETVIVLSTEETAAIKRARYLNPDADSYTVVRIVRLNNSFK